MNEISYGITATNEKEFELRMLREQVKGLKLCFILLVIGNALQLGMVAYLFIKKLL